MRDDAREIFRRTDIEQALAAYVYTATATGDTPDVRAVMALCLALGIDIKDVARRVQGVTGK